MSRLVISHCTEDKEQIESFVDFLMLGMGIARSDIFCTLQKGTLPSGAQFMEKIKEALIGCEKVVCFITPHYLRSVSCLVEMGAAWAQTGKIIPLLADSLRYDDLNHTPLQGLQMLCDHSTEDLTVLFEELRTIGIATNERLVEFNRQLTKYLHSRPSKQLLQPDSTGFYTAKKKEIRRTPPAYRCYKIDGLLQLNEPFSQEETHWIFYKAGMYEDLQEEDIIRFSIDSTELRDFADLKKPRNIYPKMLVKLTT